MTLVTTQALGSIVLRMTETNPKRGCRLRCTSITFQPVARAARGNIAPVRLRTRCMTTKTVCVRIKSCRDRERDSTTHRPVTTRTTQTAHVLMPRVIEAHPETRKPRKRFYRPCLHVGVADGANWVSGICKLLRMTSGTRCMVRSSRHCRTRRICLPSMTQETRQSRVIRIVMFEFRIIYVRALRKNRDRANNNEQRQKAARKKSATWPNQSCSVLSVLSWASESH